ncbi:MAG: hypothetical protein NTV32_06615 [Gammaproteobacteria bacterium]|nr:hypothetical protein [Gammaproteobacteria bacterium]
MKNNNNNNQDMPVFLSKHEYGRLYEAIHTSQLGLFQEVLLRSLKVLHEVLREIPVEGQSNMSVFDQKIDAICLALRRLQAIPDLYSTESEVFRNIAVTAFVFYRVLYDGTFAVFANHNKTKAHFDVDPSILFKRIPYKLYDFLGSQFWRIYELYHVVEGDLSTMMLNRDIKDFIEKACPLKIEPAQIAEEPVVTESAPVLLPEKAKKSQMKLFDDRSINPELLKQEFTAWVQGQLNQGYLLLNENGVFFSRMQYGLDLFFVDAILARYAMTYQKDVTALRQALKGFAGGKTYTVDYQGAVVEAYRLSGLEFIPDELNSHDIREAN